MGTGWDRVGPGGTGWDRVAEAALTEAGTPRPRPAESVCWGVSLAHRQLSSAVFPCALACRGEGGLGSLFEGH